jgi:hypothetical protein
MSKWINKQILLPEADARIETTDYYKVFNVILGVRKFLGSSG